MSFYLILSVNSSMSSGGGQVIFVVLPVNGCLDRSSQAWSICLGALGERRDPP